MGADAHLDWRAAAASTLAWWHEAGVDTLVDEAPRDWLAAATPPSAPLVSAAVSDVPPTAIGDYLGWRYGEAAPEAGWPGDWIAASGPHQAALMVLVDCPDRDDQDAVLTGAAGRLFERMLAAIGLTREAVHVAALCAKRPVAGRLPAEAGERLAELALHHVELIAPQRLLVMGNAASRAILATDVAVARGRLHPLNHKDGTSLTVNTQVVASYHPRFLLEKPAAKAGAWADLQMLGRNWER